MTELIKQRLVGMLIVVIAGVVFIPDLLDGQKQTSKSDFKRIPEQPDFDGRPMIKDFPEQQVKDMVAQVPVSDDVATDESVNSESNGGDTSDASGFVPQEETNVSEVKELASTNTPKTPENTVAETSNSNFSKQSDENKVVVSTLSSEGEQGVSSSTSSGNPIVEPAIKPNKSKYKKPLYILQLGSFKHKENVTTLREKLKSAGYETYIKPVKTKSAVLSKVYIGPESDRTKLKEAQVKARELTGLEGKITRFQPTN